jgi:hypothetical protein
MDEILEETINTNNEIVDEDCTTRFVKSPSKGNLNKTHIIEETNKEIISEQEAQTQKQKK